MSTTRLEAFSDGVIAIIITIMVLELKPPHGSTFEGVRAILPVFLSYVLSFLLVAIMWVNHQHLLPLARRVDARLLWANNHLLFWMSLIPFATAYLGEHPSLPLAVGLYGVVSGCAAAAFGLLRAVVAGTAEPGSGLHRHHWTVQRKNLAASGAYFLSVLLAQLWVPLAYVVFVAVPLAYFVPARPQAGAATGAGAR